MPIANFRSTRQSKKRLVHLNRAGSN